MGVSGETLDTCLIWLANSTAFIYIQLSAYRIWFWFWHESMSKTVPHIDHENRPTADLCIVFYRNDLSEKLLNWFFKENLIWYVKKKNQLFGHSFTKMMNSRVYKDLRRLLYRWTLLLSSKNVFVHYLNKCSWRNLEILEIFIE